MPSNGARAAIATQNSEQHDSTLARPYREQAVTEQALLSSQRYVVTLEQVAW